MDIHFGPKYSGFSIFEKKHLAERSFDLRTSGLWAQHASTAPLCYHAEDTSMDTANQQKY